MRAPTLLGALAALVPAVALAEPAAAPRGLAVGVEVGQPSTVTARFAALDEWIAAKERIFGAGAPP